MHNECRERPLRGSFFILYRLIYIFEIESKLSIYRSACHFHDGCSSFSASSGELVIPSLFSSAILFVPFASLGTSSITSSTLQPRQLYTVILYHDSLHCSIIFQCFPKLNSNPFLLAKINLPFHLVGTHSRNSGRAAVHIV